MSKSMMLMGLLLGSVLFLAEPAGGQGDTRRREADLVTYNRLLQEYKQVDRDYAQAVDKAMIQARRSGGQAHLETMAAILSFRDRRDRLTARLIVLSLRHGWDLPASTPGGTVRPASVPTGREQVFRPAERIIKSRFADEALRVARAIKLPVIRVAPAVGDAGE